MRTEAGKQLSRSIVENRVSIVQIVPDIEIQTAQIGSDEVINRTHQLMVAAVASKILPKMKFRTEREPMYDGWHVRGECFIFSTDELRELLKKFEHDVLQEAYQVRFGGGEPL